jgi:predicted dehydrogenase
MNNSNRRDFMKKTGAASAASFVAGDRKIFTLAEDAQAEPARRSANDQIQIALIGAGGQGQFDTSTAIQVPGVRVVAAADCYDGRLAHTKELWGNDLLATRDYREILARRDIDAVIIATPDHWHVPAAIDAMNAGKDVYLEKPMVHVINEGWRLIDAQRRTNRILQVGSQRVSSIVYKKAQQLYRAGAIGKLNLVTAWWDRNSAIGAWEYSIPTDASPQTIDWTRFLGDAPKVAFDPKQFFWWRGWRAYGTGVAGDLFVHLFSGTHFVTGVMGPNRVYATGGLHFWRDGRNYPDVLLGLFDYPEEFNLSLRVNFVNGGEEDEALVFTGSEGTMRIGRGVTLSRTPREREPGYTIETFSTAEQAAFLQWYRQKYPPEHPEEIYSHVEEYRAPEGYNDSYDHLKNFFNSVRSRQPVVEDTVFGFRAAGAALLSNVSYDEGRAVRWDPQNMKIVNQ